MKMRQMWVWMLLMALAFLNDRSHCCLDEERISLLEIKAWFNHAGVAGPYDLEGWDKEHFNCCNWYRVVCDNTTNRVIELYLAGVNYAFEDLDLNASLFLPFKELEILDFSFNQLVGGLKNQGFQVLASGLRNLEELYLGYNKFNDSILSSLNGFSTLKSLDLSGNMFTGSTGLNGWCELTNLELLSLSENNLKGVLPPCFGNLSSLRSLDLSYNQLEGNIAFSHISHLTQLKYLSISNNYFQVPISFGSFMNLSNLKLFECDNNELIAAPSFQPSAPKFQLLYFSASNCTSKPLKAGFPNFLHSQHNLMFVDLSHNKFVGEPFPSWLFENNRKLNWLYLRDTSFTSPLQLPQHPTPNLQTVDMSGNNIHGQIASNICSIFPRLKNFMMANNSLTGCIPPCFGNMSSLEYFDLSNNQMSCELLEHNFPAVGSSLWSLKLSNNNFKGRLPLSLFNMTHLKYLFLDGNKFAGQVSGTFSLASSFLWFDISNNLLSGMLPRGIGNSSIYRFQAIDLSRNQFEESRDDGSRKEIFASIGGRDSENEGFYLYEKLLRPEMGVKISVELTTKKNFYTYEGDILRYMYVMDLSCNRFTGEIPTEWGNLSGIYSLNLSRNNLTGLIPPSFSNLKQIESLDLSHNNLNGRIPEQLVELTFLAVFNVSYNNLSGRTPEMKNQFGTFDESSYKGNPLLCGPPLQNSCDKTESPSARVPNDFNGDGGFIDMDSFYASFGVFYITVVLTIAAVLCINPHWRRRWFYFIEECIDTCYCFLAINFRKLSRFRR